MHFALHIKAGGIVWVIANINLKRKKYKLP
jgi:hypothetical protein